MWRGALITWSTGVFVPIRALQSQHRLQKHGSLLKQHCLAGRKARKHFPGRNLLSNERLYLRWRGRAKNWRAWCGTCLCTGKGSISLFLFVVTAGNVCRLCPLPHHPCKGRVQLHLAMPQSSCWIYGKSGCTIPFWGTVLFSISMGLCPCSALHSCCGWWDTLSTTVAPEASFQSKYS